MNIKLEPEEVIDPDTQYDLQWENYKKEFEKSDFTIKTEENIAGNVKNVNADSTCPVTTHMPLICTSDASSSLMPCIEIQIDDVTFKKEHLEPTVVKVESRGNLDFQWSNSFPEMVAVIRLTRIPIFAKNFVCNVCFGIFPTITERTRHKLVHKKSTSIKTKQIINYGHDIPKCDEPPIEMHPPQKCTVVNDMKKHEMGHYEEESSTCEDLSFESHHTRKYIESDVNHGFLKCDYPSVKSSHMNTHDTTNSGDKPFKCAVCEFACLRPSTMKTHKMIHTGERPFQCDDCEYSCIRSADMKRHRLIHSRKKTLVCQECNYACIFPSNMKKHKIIHYVRKIYKCDDCEYSSVRSSHMKKHKMIHSGEKPLKCAHCKYSCIQSNDMKRHIMIHSGEKPFRCEECTYSSINYSRMKRHKVIHR